MFTHVQRWVDVVNGIKYILIDFPRSRNYLLHLYNELCERFKPLSKTLRPVLWSVIAAD